VCYQFFNENSRTSVLKFAFLIPTILLYALSDTRGKAQELYENMHIKAAVWVQERRLAPLGRLVGKNDYGL
jgi:hypothetical protein